ncbi:MAG: hypothetical protein EOT04_01295 [Candidatus Chaera renei]|uniref:Type 4 fimbrial biogenesis protein PilX N-terminal domain-containing protein n=1 Tax=Candidatus Chaera renei TaxID=2506947 RepID=A0A4Q0AJ21_9BACT|nr:MAG: hypothetical protein EOT04_01295 [Candidatus Chaera renei]
MVSASRGRPRQNGFVSIFTVLFFIVLITVLTFGFMRVMLNEQRQAVNNALTASAYNAAEAGVEDAKRALLRYQSLSGGTLKTAYQNALSSTTCPGIAGSSDVRKDLNLLWDANNKSVQISNQSAYLESYTCLIIQRNTDDYLGRLTANSSDLIPLRGAAPFTKVEISWHKTSSDADKIPAGYPLAGELYDTGTWASRGYPAMLRAQFMENQQSSFQLNQLDNLNRTVFLQPVRVGSSVPPTGLSLDTYDPKSPSPSKNLQPVSINCSDSAAYACRVIINLDGPMDPGGKLVYLRLSSLYVGTNFQVRLLDGASRIVPFDGVQPLVDSTGKANDAFRRVLSRVRLDVTPFYPAYALEVGNGLCKDLFVGLDASSYRNNCP